MFGSRLRFVGRSFAAMAKNHVVMGKLSVRPAIAYRAFSTPAGASDKKPQESTSQAKSDNGETSQKTDIVNMDYDEYDDYEPKTAKEKVRGYQLFHIKCTRQHQQHSCNHVLGCLV